MSGLVLRTARVSDFDRIVELNAVEVAHTSPMDRVRLSALAEASSYCKVATLDEEVVAFLIALSSSATYENDNFSWFLARFDRFLYVDRIVVSAAHFGHRIGSRLYEDLFAFARTQGLERVTCEYNIEPPNEASRAFHDRFGFQEVGTQWVANGAKRVSLQVADT